MKSRVSFWSFIWLVVTLLVVFHVGGGWYFSSEVARILDGAAVTVEEGITALGAARSPRPGGAAAAARGGSG